MDIAKTILKVLVIAFVYLGLGPLLGYYLKGKDFARRVTLGFMAWWLVRPPSDFTLMLYSIEKFRGHARGFEFNFIEAIAIGLALAALLEKRKDFRYLPPGLLSWFLFIFVGLLSVPGAMNPLYALMPAFKFAKMGFVLVGVFAAVHDERDLKAIMRGFAIALIIQVINCLWGRYVLGGFRVMGWFEHQNPMAMWSYMVAFPILGLAISKETTQRDMILFFSAFASAGLVVVLSVSRASLAAFGVGAVLVMAGSFLQGFTTRRVVLGVCGALGGAVVLAVAADTLMSRMGGDDSPKNDLRYALNLQAAAMNRDHPFVGIGWNNFGLANSRPLGMKYSKILEHWEENRGQRIYAKNFMANPLTESLYWLILAENGKLGFLAFMFFMLSTLWYGMRSTLYFWKTPLGLVLYGITIALLVTYFHMQVERVLVQTKNLTTWMMFCALVSRAEWWRRSQKARQRELR
jgi:hypothetical protein